MKTKSLFFWLLLPFLAFVMSSCSEAGGGSGMAAITPSVSIDEVTFDNSASAQIVTINLGKYKFFGAFVDASGESWCFVEILDEKATGKIKITAQPNTTNAPRSCRVNVWVANTDDPDDEDKEELEILVEQSATGGGGGGGGGSDTPSVTPDEINLAFNDDSFNVVTINRAGYNYYGADLDEAYSSWCKVQVMEYPVGTVKIKCWRNGDHDARSCIVNCWVSNKSNPSESEKVILPVHVTQQGWNIDVYEATLVDFVFKSNAATDLIWTYDGGGSMHFNEMMELWRRDWNNMSVVQYGDKLVFEASHTIEHSQNGDLYYDHEFNFKAVISGFVQPFDHCVADTIYYYHHASGTNPDPNGYWQTSVTYESVTMMGVPCLYDDITLGVSSLTFRCEGLGNVPVVEAYSNNHSTTKDGHWQERNHQYVGSAEDYCDLFLKFRTR